MLDYNIESKGYTRKKTHIASKMKRDFYPDVYIILNQI